MEFSKVACSLCSGTGLSEVKHTRFIKVLFWWIPIRRWKEHKTCLWCEGTGKEPIWEGECEGDIDYEIEVKHFN